MPFFLKIFASPNPTFQRIAIPFIAFLVVLAFGASASPAFAQVPWWQVSSGATPTNLPSGGTGEIKLAATNLGDGEANGELTPMMITDKLPAGLTATAISGVSGPSETNPGSNGHGPVTCLLASLSCTFAGRVAPYERLWIEIKVEVAPDAVTGIENEAQITGGGAPSVSVKRPLSISKAPTAFGVEDYELIPEEEGGAQDTQAGSHPFQLTSTIVLDQTAEKPYQPAKPKDLHFDLPAGLVGNPTPSPQCTDAEFATLAGAANQCPASTAVGVAMITAETPGSSLGAALGLFTVRVPLFNVEPSVGEPARFGFEVYGNPVFLDTAVRTGGDYGVTVNVNNVTETASFLAARVTFWGVPGDPRHDASRGWTCLGYADTGESCVLAGQSKPPPLLTLPSSCAGQLESSVTTDSWLEPGVFGPPASYSLQNLLGEPVTLGGCNHLPFSPSIGVAPDGTAGSMPTGLTVDVHVPQEVSQDATALSEADVKDTTVALPVGVQVSPSGGNGLEACSDAQIGFTGVNPLTGSDEFTDAAPSCPDGSKIATVKITSPLLANPLEGAVYLAAPQNFAGLPQNPFGSLIAMYIVAEDLVSGTLVKLPGRVSLNPVTGQLVTTFENTPQLPFEDLELHFFGGERAPLSTPSLCGSYTTQASFTPWSENGVAEPSSSFDITSGPNGAPCSDPPPFAPSLVSDTTNINAGSFSPLTTTLSREDGQQSIQSVQLHYPPGLSGLLSSVKLCGEAEANAGTCGAESEIGETIVSVGLGGDPYTVTSGKVYITGPYEGAPFGLSIVNPAKAGPFDLQEGRPVIVRAKIEVDPHTAALTITTDPPGSPHAIPTIIEGIPLQIKHVDVTINGVGGNNKFTFNPTNCAKMAITGAIDSAEGASSPVSVPFQVTNCASLKFTPKFAVSTSGKTSKADGASLTAKVTEPNEPQGSQANISKVKVELPKQLPSRLTTLQKACADAQFEANPAACPSESKIGYAVVHTPLLPVPLEGPAIFVSHGGEAFPSLTLVLQGDGVTIDLVGATDIKNGVTSTTFETVPDAPFNTFQLTLPEGKYSALAANGDLCRQKLVMPTAFTAQNGATFNQKSPIAVAGCSNTLALVSKKLKGRTLTLHIAVPAAGKLKLSAKGLSSASKSSSGRETVTVKLQVKRHGKFTAKVKLSFKPKSGKGLSKTVKVYLQVKK